MRLFILFIFILPLYCMGGNAIDITSIHYVRNNTAQLGELPLESWTQTTLPHSWRDLTDSPKQLWYKISFQPRRQIGGLWAVYMPKINMNAKVYLNGQAIGTGGRLSNPLSRNWNHPQLFSIPGKLMKPGENTLHILLASYGPFGYLHNIEIGPYDTLKKKFESRYFWQVTLNEIIAGFLFIGSLFLFAVWRNRPEMSVFKWFGLANLVFAIRTTKLFIVNQPLPNYLFEWFDFCALWCYEILVILALQRFAQRYWRSFDISIVFGSLAVFTFLLFIALGFPESFFTWSHLFKTLLFPLGMFPLWFAINLYHREPSWENLILALVGAQLLLFGFHDWLLVMGYIDRLGMHMLQYSILIALLYYSWILVKRLTGAEVEAEELRTQIAHHHQSLEDFYNQVVTSKITRPETNHLFTNKRQIKALGSNINKPLLWLTAPAGSGKSVLASTFIADRNIDYIWYHLDKHDKDCISFLSYIQYAADLLRQRNNLFPSPSSVLDPAATLDLYYRKYFSRLFCTLPNPFIIVFDDFNRIDKDDFRCNLLLTCIQELPPHGHVIITSRSPIHPAFYPLLNEDKIQQVDWSLLAWNKEECRELIKTLPNSMSQDQNIIKKARGWIAGLIFLSKQETVQHDNFFNYMEDHIMPPSKEERYKLYQLALCDVTCKSVVSEIGIDPENIPFYNSNCKDTTHLHPLLQEFLIYRIQTRFGQDQQKALYLQTARHLEKTDYLYEAINLLIKSENYSTLCALLEENRNQLSNKEFIEYYNRVPKTILQQNPQVYYHYAKLLEDQAPEKAMETYRSIANLSSSTDLKLNYWLSFFRCAFSSGKIQNIGSAASEAGPLTKGNNANAELVYFYCFFSTIIDPANSGINPNQDSAYPTTTVDVTDLNFLCHFLSANWSGLHQLYQTKQLPYIKSTIQCLSGDFENGLKTINDVLQTSQDKHLLSLTVGIIIAVISGNTVVARQYLQDMKTIINGRELQLAIYFLLQSWLENQNENYQEALLSAENALLHAKNIKLSLITQLSQIQIAICRQLCGHSEQASQAIDNIQLFLSSHHNSLGTYLFHYARARILFSLAENKKALSSLKTFLRICRDSHWLHFPFQNRCITTAICNQAIKYGIEEGTVYSLIQTYQIEPNGNTLDLYYWPWPIKVYTFGHFCLLVDGEPLKTGRKSHRKLQETLMLLISMGGSNVKGEMMAGQLWPDLDGDAAYNALTTTIYRMRKLLGHDVIQINQGRLSINRKRCWVDIWALEDGLSRVGDLSAYELAKKKLPEKIFHIYKGPFLEKETDMGWAISTREKFRTKLVGFIRHTATKYYQIENYEEAIKLYEKGLEIDDLSELLYQGLIRCYIALNLNSEGLKVYRRCQQILSKVLQVPPSSESEKLRRLLQQDQPTELSPSKP